ALDRHLDQHGALSETATRPCRLFGPALVMDTGISRPIQPGSPAKFTTVFPDVRPASSSGRRRDCESTSTSCVCPTRLWCQACCVSRWSDCSATIRDVFSTSGTSSGSRLSASVLGRGEYLNENID